MKRICILWLGALLLAAVSGKAQNTMADVLKAIEQNSKTLEANSKLAEARKMEAKTGKFLANPRVGFDHMWGKGENKPKDYSISVTQAVDFPSTYIHQNKLSKLKQETIGFQFADFRQQLMLEAQKICIELVYLYKEKDILDERLSNARHLCEVYCKRMENGTANQIEDNKVKLERLNLENQSHLNQTNIAAALKKLQNLNGGRPIAFSDRNYMIFQQLPFQQLCEEFMAADPAMRSLNGEQQIAEREIKLSRSAYLPKIDFGYKHADSSVGEAANGLTLEISIPLFEKKNTVKKSKVQAEYAQVALDNHKLELYIELQKLYDQAQVYRQSMQEYASVLEQKHNLKILDKARDAGQISVIAYCLEVSSIYDSWMNYIELERDYNLILAQLYQYRL